MKYKLVRTLLGGSKEDAAFVDDGTKVPGVGVAPKSHCDWCPNDVTYPHVVPMQGQIAEICDDCYEAISEGEEITL